MGWLLIYLVAGIIFACMARIQMHQATWAQSNWAQRTGAMTSCVMLWWVIIIVIFWDDLAT